MKKIISTFMLLITGSMLFAQQPPPPKEFCRHVNNAGFNNDVGNDIVPTAAGGYIIAGTMRETSTDIDMYAIKFSASNLIDFSVRIGDIPAGGSLNENGYSVLESVEAGVTYYYVIGSVDVTAANKDVFVVKLNSLGAMVWGRRYGGTSARNEVATKGVLSTIEGSATLIVTGFTNNLSAADYNMFVMTISLGNGINGGVRTFGNTSAGLVTQDKAFDIIKISTGGYMLAGERTNPGTAAQTDMMFVKLDASLNLAAGTNALYITSPGNESANAIIEYSGNFFGLGYTTRLGTKDIYLVKFSPGMVPLDNAIYGAPNNSGDEIGTDIIISTDPKFVITGIKNSITSALKNGLYLKVDPVNLASVTYFKESIFNTLTDGLNALCQQNATYIVTTGFYNTTTGSANDEIFYNRFKLATGGDNICCFVDYSHVPQKAHQEEKDCQQINTAFYNTLHGREVVYGSVTTLCQNYARYAGPQPQVTDIAENSVRVSPNPARGLVDVHFQNAVSKIDAINIYSISGQCIKQLNDMQINSTATAINLTDLSDGIYIMQVTTGHEKFYTRIAIQK